MVTFTIPVWLVLAVLAFFAVVTVVLACLAYLAKVMLGPWPED